MEREIKYDRETRDYACYVDGELIGFAKSYHDGEIVCDRYIFDELSRNAPIEPSRDEAHRQERWGHILDEIAAMPEPQQSEMVQFALFTLDHIISQRPPMAAAA